MKPKSREDLAVVELDGEAVIFDERSGELHHLNPTATVVFKCFDGSASVKEIADDIAAEAGLPPKEVEKQVRGLLRQFRQAGLIDGGLPVARSQDSGNG